MSPRSSPLAGGFSGAGFGVPAGARAGLARFFLDFVPARACWALDSLDGGNALADGTAVGCPGSVDVAFAVVGGLDVVG